MKFSASPGMLTRLDSIAKLDEEDRISPLSKQVAQFGTAGLTC